MQIIFTERFKKKFNKLPKKIQDQFEKRLEIFVCDSLNPILKIHPLHGNLAGLRAFSVNGDYRVVYRLISKDTAKLVDIGTHSQVY